jgi:hypothetical protein
MMEDVMLCDGFGKAFLGILTSFKHPPIAVYDKSVIISILMERDEMTYEDACEFFDFNIIGAYVGEQTPGFIDLMSIEQFDSIVNGT